MKNPGLISRNKGRVEKEKSLKNRHEVSSRR